MTRIGKIILNVIVLATATAGISAAVGPIFEAYPPWRVYACDFRLISAATCDLPMAAHTTRVTPTAAESERAKRVARREHIIACERERTRLRQNGQPEPETKCWE